MSAAWRARERGQAIPFWVLSTLMVLTLLFFVINYANTVRWQIRAQNAADSSAIAKIAGDAQILNSFTLLLYALNIQNLKTEALLGEVTNLLGGQTSCGTLGLACVGSYPQIALNDVQNVSAMTQIVNQLTTATSQVTTLAANPAGTVNQLAGQGCVKLQTDCSFTYKTVVTLPAGAPPLTVQIDEYSCHIVQPLGGSLLHLGSPFYAIGHASIQLSPLASVLQPGVTRSSTNGTPDFPVQQLIPGNSGSGLQLDPTQGYNPATGQQSSSTPFQVNLSVLIPQQVPGSTPQAGLLASLEAACGT